MAKLSREVIDLPCTMYFDDAEWKALMVVYTNQDPILPANPSTLRQVIRLLVSLSGFLGRKGDGEPGTKSLWLVLQRIDDMAAMWKILTPHSSCLFPRVQQKKVVEVSPKWKETFCFTMT